MTVTRGASPPAASPPPPEETAALTRALLAANQRERWLQAAVPFPALVLMYAVTGGRRDAALAATAAALLVAAVVALLWCALGRRALQARLRTAALDASLADATDAAVRGATGRPVPATSEARSDRRVWMAVVGAGALAAVVTFAAVVGRGARDRSGSASAGIADSVENARADSTIARAAREQPTFDALRAALTPAAYAHDTSFAQSVLAEERARGAPECRQAASDADEAHTEALAQRMAGGTSASTTGTADDALNACVVGVVRRALPLVSRADSVRDSVRLVVRDRFRRAARTMLDSTLAARHRQDGVSDALRAEAYDPGANGRFPGAFDASHGAALSPASMTRPTP